MLMVLRNVILFPFLALLVLACGKQIEAPSAPLDAPQTFRVPGNAPVFDPGFKLMAGKYYLFHHVGGEVCLEAGRRCAPPSGSDLPGDESWGLHVVVGTDLVQVRDGAVLSVESAAPLKFFVGDGESLSFTEQTGPTYDDNSGEWVIQVTPFDSAPEPEWMHGVSVTSYTRNGYCSPEMPKLLTRLRDMGADAIQLVPVLVTDGTSIFPVEFSPDAACVAKATRAAHRLGFKVAWNLHVDPEKEGWRGSLDVPDHAAFIQEYADTAALYARLAQDLGVEFFIPATEMVSLTRTDADRNSWLALFERLHSIYFGLLTYGADRTELEELCPEFWLACCDAVGLTAWHTLSVDDAPTVEQLQTSWNPIVSSLEKLSEEVKMRVLIPEGPGYRPIKGCAREPSDYIEKGEPSDICQVVAYQAWLATFTNNKRSHFWGAFLWEVSAPGEPNSDYSPLGRVAETVVKRAWTSQSTPASR